MMGVIMGRPQAKDKVLREHQKGASELRGLSRKLAHVAGLAALGSRKKETLCLKVGGDGGECKCIPLPQGSVGEMTGLVDLSTLPLCLLLSFLYEFLS